MSHTHSPWVATKSIHGLYHIYHGSRKVASVAALPQGLEMEANARLIAAAPDLLAVAERIKTYCDGVAVGQPQKEQLLFELYHELGTAIAKAKGQDA